MFKFLKEKLGNLFKKKSKEIVEEAEKKEPEAEIKEKITEKKRKIEERKEELIEEIKEIKKEEINGIKERKKERDEEKIEEKKKRIQELEEQRQEMEEKEEIEEKMPVEKKGFFSRIFKKFSTIKLEEEQFESFWNELELVLIENNAALEVIDKIKEKLKKDLLNKEIKKDKVEDEIRNALKNAISELLIEPFDLVEMVKSAEKPFVILFFGINGSGKTTTIAKITSLFLKNKLSCVLAAADTFRAASIEQLEQHSEKLGVKIIKHDYQADPAAVAFDAIKHAKTKSIDVVLIDTAGRMHTHSNLLAEMKKIERVAKPNLKIFIGESITGNDAVEQAKRFNESIGIDGIILSKADVDERGGASISVGYATGKPILYLGTGQGYNDIEKFDKEKVISGIGL